MKIFLVVAALIFSCTVQAQQSALFENSPLNYDNSAANFNNSPANFQNSPLNWENSRMNINGTNGVFDQQGNRIGYEVTAPSGVVNRFDNDGNRTGYRRK